MAPPRHVCFVRPAFLDSVCAIPRQDLWHRPAVVERMALGSGGGIARDHNRRDSEIRGKAYKWVEDFSPEEIIEAEIGVKVESRVVVDVFLIKLNEKWVSLAFL